MIEDKPYKYKIAKKQHWNSIIELWESNSKWGAITIETLKKWIMAPYADCDITIVINEEEQVLGMCFLTYTYIRTPKSLSKAVRFSAPILSEQIKGNNLLDPKNPLNKLFEFSFQVAAENECHLVYMNPIASWSRVLRVSHFYGFPKFYVNTYNFIEIRPKSQVTETNMELYLIDDYNKEHAKIWNAFTSASDNLFAIERSRKWLRYKSGDYLKIEARDSQKMLKGILIYDQNRNLIYDVIVEKLVDLEEILTQALIFLQKNNLILDNNQSVKILATPTFQNLFEFFEVSPIKFEQAFAVTSISQQHSIEEISSANWYITSLD